MKYKDLAVSFAALAIPMAAQAQQQGGDVALEEIIVTADRPESFGADLVQVGTFRNARIIDVPLTVNVVPQELIRSQAVAGIYDALRNTAGVSRSQLNGSTYDNIAVRGILVENRTSYRLNGSLPTINLVDLPLENKERVEVLKGVGALYYGFAPPSGIINLVTKRATRDVTQFTSSLTDHGAVAATADISRRITDNFGLRFNGAAGIVQTGVDRVDGDRYVAALAADWDVSEAVSVKLDLEHVAKDVTETAAIQLPAAGSPLVPPAMSGAINLPPLPDPRLNLGGHDLRYDAWATNVLGRVDVRLSPQFALTVEGGQAITERDRDFSQFESLDLRPGSPGFGNGTLRIFRTRDQRYRNRNARTELVGAFATGPVAHNLIVGATSNWRFQNGRNATQVTAVQNYFTPRDVQVAEPGAFTLAPLNVRDRGVYVVDRAKLGPIELLGGLRYSEYRSRSTAANGSVTRFSLKRWTPSVGAIVKPSERTSLYATYLEGLEEGGTAPINNANGGEVLPPAVSKQYELGVKGEALAGVIFQLAGFEISRPFAFTDPVDNMFKLAGRSRYRGIEASVTGEILRTLSVYASGQYLDAEVRRAAPATLIGREPENTPKWTGSLYAEYRPTVLEGFAIGGGAFYVGRRAVNALNQAFVDGYTTFSASARYTIRGIGAEGLTLQLNADNLTDKRYWSTAGNNLLGVGLPRQIKLTTRIGL
ncbi:TonB-dependent siderophore receptor [Sphingomonas oleivorans]|nr:TonB-dependent siderophore receptor [Sphingomonas oleivorans]